MRVLFLLAVLPYVFAAPSVDLNLVRELQTGVAKNKPTNILFRSFKEVFGKKYDDDDEENMRMKIFEVNVKIIREHNLRYEKNESTYFLGVNQFSDLTHKEFLALYTSEVAMDAEKLKSSCSTFLTPSNILMSDQVDWRKRGYVTPVKNQGQCGSCWAFSSTGALEGQHFKKTGRLVSLSEQQLVDCSTKFGNQGCNGGLQPLAFEYIKQAGGIEGETDYPYTAKDGRCKFNSKYIRATDSGCEFIRRGSETSLQEATATVGPIAVSIDASRPSFQSYMGGTYYDASCSETKLDHAVLVVGYGSDSTGNYWIVKNSWGPAWGLGGYIHMAKNKGNNCGIATAAVYPKV